MNIIITGNLGYVGSELTEQLKVSHQFKKVIGIDTGFFLTDHTSFSIYKNPIDIQFFQDIRNIDQSLFNGVDVVVHLAAVSNDPIGGKFKEATNEINFLSTKLIYDLCKSKKVRKFIYASSCSMYGYNENCNLDENSQLNPLTDYAFSKVNSEDYIKNNIGGTEVISMRFATAAGPSHRLRLDLLINEITFEALTKKSITLKSNGNAYRPFIDVRDMCKSIIWAIDYNFTDKYNVLNIGSNLNNHKVYDIAKIVAHKAGLSNNSIRIGNSTDNRSYNVRFDKFLKLSNNLKMFTMEETINDLINQINSNKFLLNNNNLLKRLSKLEFLLSNNLINEKLHWK